MKKTTLDLNELNLILNVVYTRIVKRHNLTNNDINPLIDLIFSVKDEAEKLDKEAIKKEYEAILNGTWKTEYYEKIKEDFRC